MFEQPFDSPMEKMQIARAKLLGTNPFFARLAYKLALKESTQFKTAATDGISLHFNAGYVWGLPMRELIMVWAHEVLHPALRHHTRRNGRDAVLWNKAADYVVNIVLVKAGFKLPSTWLYDPMFDGMAVEKVFNILNSQQPGNGDQNPQPDGQPQPGDNNPSGDDPQQPDNNPQSDDDQSESGDDDPQPGADQPCGPGDVIDYPGESDESEPDPNDIAQHEQSWDLAVANAMQIAKARGVMPGGLKDMVDEILESRVDWRDVTRHFLERIAANDYSWEQPDRRYIQQGLFLPSLYNHEMGDMVVAVDTSSSRSLQELQQDMTELSEILGLYDTTLHLIFVDSEFQGYQQYSRDDLPLKIDFLGRGGTCFTPAFEWVDEHRDELNMTAMIYLTDMECHDFPSDPPDYPVLWIQNGTYHNPPPFGELVIM